MKKSLNQLLNEHQNLFVQHPYSYWAKMSDRVVHIPVDRNSGKNGTECGSHAALLGNNYAPLFKEKNIFPVPICPKCLQIIYWRQMNLKEILTAAEVKRVLGNHYTGDYNKDVLRLVKFNDAFCTESVYPIIINTATGLEKASGVNLENSFHRLKQSLKKNPR